MTDSIIHLQRGHIFEIEGKTFFTLGGCKSSDKRKEMGLWYPQEDPSQAEIKFAIKNLQNKGNKVDFILTHKYEKPRTNPDPYTLAGITKYIDEKVAFKHWYAGHWHLTQLNRRHFVVYSKLIKIG